ncbi:MAG: hypothetical protein LWX51_11345 [Deltaproteobacteria bacterium]|jgi:hypothetical protein|nr:hypothetical protein [Deltaproteobacteria bacterium]
MKRNIPDIDIYTWDEVNVICKKLIALIDKPFDVIVCIMRGGAVPGVIIANELGIDEVIAIKIVQDGQRKGANPSEDTGEPGVYRAEKGVVLVPLNDFNLKGKRVLVVDDVLDSGQSIKTALNEIHKQRPADVKLAVMQKKTYSQIEPDYCVETRTNWLFYPWMSLRELEEMKKNLARKARP